MQAGKDYVKKIQTTDSLKVRILRERQNMRGVKRSQKKRKKLSIVHNRRFQVMLGFFSYVVAGGILGYGVDYVASVHGSSFIFFYVFLFLGCVCGFWATYKRRFFRNNVYVPRVIVKEMEGNKKQELLRSGVDAS